MIEFVLPIAPVAKGRPRLSRHGTYTPEKTARFEREVQLLAQRYRPEKPLDCAIELTVSFELERPKRSNRLRPTCRPDLDNFAKAVMDSLNGMFWEDDSQIVSLHAFKRYATKSSIYVLIAEHEGEDDER